MYTLLNPQLKLDLHPNLNYQVRQVDRSRSSLRLKPEMVSNSKSYPILDSIYTSGVAKMKDIWRYV